MRLSRHRIVFFMICALLSIMFFDLFFLNTAMANSTDLDVLSGISNKFYTKSEAWASTLENAALSLFYWFILIDIGLFGIRAAIDMHRGNPLPSIVGEFTMFIFFAGFMFSCIKYYKQWSNQVLNGFASLGNTLGFSKIEEGDIFRAGLDMAGNTWNAMDITSPLASLGFLIAGLVLLFCFALMAAEVLLVKCESYVVMNAGIFLLGFGGMRYFKDYSINFMKYGFTVGVKLFVLQLLMGMAGSFIDDFKTIEPTWGNIAVVMGAAVVMLALVKNIPGICSSLIMGAHGAGGGSGGMAMMAASAAIGAGVAAGMKTAFNTGSTVNSANAAANADGATGWGKAAHMAGTVAGAMGKSGMENLHENTQGLSFGRRTASHAAAVRQQAEMSQQDQQPQAPRSGHVASGPELPAHSPALPSGSSGPGAVPDAPIAMPVGPTPLPPAGPSDSIALTVDRPEPVREPAELSVAPAMRHTFAPKEQK